MARLFDVAIVGGGVAGLVVAHRLAARRGARPVRVAILDRQPRWGGLVHTQRRNSWLFEGGADSMVTAKPAGLELCQEIGLGSEIIEPTSAASFSLVRGGRLHRLPDGFRMIAPTRIGPLLRSSLFSPMGKARISLERFVPRTPQLDDESVESFVTRRFGREIYERVAAPVLGGLFVADASRLSARRTVGPFLQLEARYGSVARGLRAAARGARPPGSGSPEGPALKTLRHGMGSLVTRLVERIPNDWLFEESEVRRARAPSERGGRWRLETSWPVDGGVLEARALVLACPAPRAGALVMDSLPGLAGALGELEFASCATVSLVYRRRDFPSLPRDFGLFVPPTESRGVLAATYSSLKFEGRAPADDVVIRTFHGGALDCDAVELDDDALVERAHRSMADLLGIVGRPDAAWVFRARHSMPQFAVGHLERVAVVEQRAARVPGLHLAGSALGLYGIPDCVNSGESAAEGLLADLVAPQGGGA